MTWVRYSLISTTLPRPKATLTQCLPAISATPVIVPLIRTGWPADSSSRPPANVGVERIAGLQTLGHDRLDGRAVGDGGNQQVRQVLRRIGNINALRRRAPHSWAPSP
jgi:hypothetical protein